MIYFRWQVTHWENPRPDWRGLAQTAAAILVPALLWLLVVFAGGCASALPPQGNSLRGATSGVIESGKSIEGSAGSIKRETANARQVVLRVPGAEPISVSLDNIDGLATLIQAEASKLTTVYAQQLQTAQREREQLERAMADQKRDHERALADLKKEHERAMADAKREADAKLAAATKRADDETKRANAAEAALDNTERRWFTFAAILSGVAVAASIALGVWLGNVRLAACGAVGGMIGVAVFSALARWMAWLPIAGVVLLALVLLGVGLWLAYRKGWLTNPHLVNPAEQLGEALTLAARGRTAEAAAILRTTEWGERQYQRNLDLRLAAQLNAPAKGA